MQQLLFHNTFLDAPLYLSVSFFLILLVAAAFDVKTFTIPHKFPVAVLAIFVVAALLLPLSLAGWGWHILSAFIAFVLGSVLFVLRVMGGGDVKLFAAIGLWIMPSGILGLTLCVTLSGLVLGLLHILFKMVRVKSPDPAAPGIKARYQSIKSTRIAYGPAISIGTLIYVLLST